jgi:hypothetical protein
MHDALYIPLDIWYDFFHEPYDRQLQPDLEQHNFGVDCNLTPTRIAAPEALLRSEATRLPSILAESGWWFPKLEVLFIIVEAQPDLQPVENDMKVQRRWEVCIVQGGAFFWNCERGGFDFEGGEYIGDASLYRLIEEVGDGLREELEKRHIRGWSFEIRPVFAVGR